MPLKALIITAHGSRKQSSNDEVISLVKKFDRETQHGFDFVVCAYMQLATPDLDHQIDLLAGQGVKKMVVFPFFIGSGSHITTDIPNLIDNAKKRHPDVEIVMTIHLGRLEDIENIILNEVKKY